MSDDTTPADPGPADDWHVTIHLSENRTETGARALLTARDRELTGRGQAHRSPYDPDVPRIGDELAAGRALMDLGRQLLQETEQDIEVIEGHPVHLSR
ncbi:hypothetical protein ABH926_006411 [Catenulispora sp. GP43]|uniref:DUF1876 domain-containing protein n=1 Tax=Catenulispora sp. GP43 TaxID=3156263 RepID=UPI003514C443